MADGRLDRVPAAELPDESPMPRRGSLALGEGDSTGLAHDNVSADGSAEASGGAAAPNKAVAERVAVSPAAAGRAVARAVEEEVASAVCAALNSQPPTLPSPGHPGRAFPAGLCFFPER